MLTALKGTLRILNILQKAEQTIESQEDDMIILWRWGGTEIRSNSMLNKKVLGKGSNGKEG